MYFPDSEQITKLQDFAGISKLKQMGERDVFLDLFQKIFLTLIQLYNLTGGIKSLCEDLELDKNCKKTVL